MRKKYQKGGFKYDKVGNTVITSKDVNKINKATGIQFTPEFSESYFSTSTPPPTSPQKKDFSQIPIMDITMGGFGERRVWNIRPENLVGNSEPQEGKHYYNVYPKQWDAYQKSPEYLNYINKDRAGIVSMEEGGEIEIYQSGGWNMADYKVNNPFTPNRGSDKQQSSAFLQNPNNLFNSSYGVPQAPPSWKTSPPVKQTSTTNQNSNSPANSPATKPLTIAQFQRPPIPTDASMEEINTPQNNNPSKYTMEEALKGEMLTDLGNVSSTIQNQEQQTAQPFQFNNYFNGVNIPQAAGYLGESIANQDTLGIVTSGAKLATGIGRNLLSGIGSQNRQNQIMKDYADEQRDVLTQANRPTQLTDQGYGEDIGYYQEGGQAGAGQEEMIMQVAQALQQGADPQEVLQQLLQMGVPEEQAIQLIEGIMQQEVPQQEQPMMQNGGEYLNQIKGKRIVDYKFNPETGNYDIDYED